MRRAVLFTVVLMLAGARAGVMLTGSLSVAIATGATVAGRAALVCPPDSDPAIAPAPIMARHA
jgi:hypothetical protein